MSIQQGPSCYKEDAGGTTQPLAALCMTPKKPDIINMHTQQGHVVRRDVLARASGVCTHRGALTGQRQQPAAEDWRLCKIKEERQNKEDWGTTQYQAFAQTRLASTPRDPHSLP